MLTDPTLALSAAIGQGYLAPITRKKKTSGAFGSAGCKRPEMLRSTRARRFTRTLAARVVVGFRMRKGRCVFIY